MSRILSFILLMLPASAFAQFTVSNTAITVQSGAILTVDSLSLQPTATLTLANTQLTRSSTSQAIASGNSINRVYTFTNAPVFTGTIQIMYSDAEMNGNTETMLRVVHSTVTSGGTWTIASSNTVNATSNTLSTTLNNASLARVSASSSSTPLPVTLVSFTAKKQDRTAVLNWEVENEHDLESYTVERSADAVIFTAMGTVKAASRKAYDFTDHQPDNGINYYRLKLNDLDGSISYSAIRSLNFQNGSVVFNAYPNPVKDDFLTITTTDASSSGMEGVILDLTGRTIQLIKLTGTETKINTTSWLAGTYLIKLQNGLSFKIVKL